MNRLLVSLALAFASVACVADPVFAEEPLTPDACFGTPACRADFDGNGRITALDFSQFFAAYGKSWSAVCLADPVCRFDFDGSGSVTPADFATMLQLMEASQP